MILIIKKQKGAVSLVEVLVTTLIIAIGLLGASSMQLLSLKGSASSHHRVQTTLLVNELAERMRFNPAGVNAGNYTLSSTSPLSCANLPSHYKDCSKNVCSSDLLALFDLYQISCGLSNESDLKKGGIKNQLPQGTLSVECGSQTCAENVEHTITIGWLSNVTSGDNTQRNESVILSFIP
ncbi:MAG: type IV pilus modification protein PilV [Cocleimonas sp.]|nr:type IV pilus modification protein PilV [Cocleimonas sp.]